MCRNKNRSGRCVVVGKVAWVLPCAGLIVALKLVHVKALVEAWAWHGPWIFIVAGGVSVGVIKILFFLNRAGSGLVDRGWIVAIVDEAILFGKVKGR